MRPPEAFVFDAYGTLLDVGRSTSSEAAFLGDRAAPLAELWRQRQLEYSWLRSLMGHYANFATVTADALDYAMARLGIVDPGLRDRLLRAYRQLEPFPEAGEVLGLLRRRGHRAIILSNGEPEILRAAVASAGLEESIEAVLSVDELRVFKPSPEVYLLATRWLRLPPSSVGFVSSNAWDAAGAASAGLRALWVNRSGMPRERLPGEIVGEVPDLRGVPAALGLR